jgi:hypothetical protein
MDQMAIETSSDPDATQSLGITTTHQAEPNVPTASNESWDEILFMLSQGGIGADLSIGPAMTPMQQMAGDIPAASSESWDDTLPSLSQCGISACEPNGLAMEPTSSNGSHGGSVDPALMEASAESSSASDDNDPFALFTEQED